MTSPATATSTIDKKSVYILRLEHGKYYVGATSDLEQRLERYRQGLGAKWTQEHPVIEVGATNPDLRSWKAVEKEATLRMMAAYGWQNVRGGPWTQRNLSSPPKALKAIID